MKKRLHCNGRLIATLLSCLFAVPVTQAQDKAPPTGGTPPATAPPTGGVDISSLLGSGGGIGTKNEIQASGDFLYGQGYVTLPFQFGLANENPTKFTPVVTQPDRKSDYFTGGTVSYSRGQAFFIDLSYARGSSSGGGLLPLGGATPEAGTFTISDDVFQVYFRYTPKRFRGTRLSPYIRIGVTYALGDVKALLDNEATQTHYQQTDKITDYLGNVGFGLNYWFYRGDQLKIGFQFEGEGFYGTRSQSDQESLSVTTVVPRRPPVTSLTVGSASIHNSLYGGIGRGTFRFQYTLGSSGLFKVFADGGMQTKYTEIQYSGFGNKDELLWGPYARVGFSYSF